MRHRIFAQVLLVAAVAAAPAWAVEPEGRSEAVPEKPPATAGARQREGGRSMAPNQESREGTEDGLPEARGEAPDRRERLVVEPRWRLGVYAYNTPTGVVITRVAPGSPAWRVGLEPGDRIVTVSGYQVGFVGERVYYLGEELQLRAEPRGRVLLLVQNVRGNGLLNVPVQLESRRHIEPVIPMPRPHRETPGRERQAR